MQLASQLVPRVLRKDLRLVGKHLLLKRVQTQLVGPIPRFFQRQSCICGVNALQTVLDPEPLGLVLQLR